MVDGDIKVGDVVHDLADNGKRLQVVAKAAASITEHREHHTDIDLETYGEHPLLDVDATDTVWECVYLDDSPTTEYTSTYDFPASRLARAPVEEAAPGLARLQDGLIRVVLQELFQIAGRDDLAGSEGDLFDVASHSSIDTWIVEEARELASVDDHFDAEASADDEELGDFERGDA